MSSSMSSLERNKASAPKNISIVFFSLLLGFFMLTPLYLLIKISFAEPWEVMTQNPTLLPHSFTLEHWRSVLNSNNLWEPMFKSFRVATFTTLIATIIVAPAAYAISRLGRKIRFAFIFLLFATKMFPAVGIALPISVTFLRWNLLDTDLGLILAHLITQIPYMAWILVSTFSAIPYDLEEAGQMDGANRFQILSRIVFPVALQGIAVAAMYVWLNSWNEFTFAVYLSLTTRTLPLGVYYYSQRGNMFLQAAYATILTIPVLFVTFFLQKYLRSDYLSGGIKG